MGFESSREQILMSTHSLIRYLLKKKHKRIFLLGTKSMRQMLKKEKIVHTKSDPSAVVVGFDKTLTYQKLLDACRLIEKGIPWIVTHPDVYCPTNEGLEPDCGAIAALVGSATRTSPAAVLGKPHPSMIDEALKRLKLRKDELVLIGDRLSTDIAMAQAARIDELLVLSGETTLADLKTIKKKRLFGIVSSVQDLID
jgi:HAD superfamily hydrolase (TIGR01450 family)